MDDDKKLELAINIVNSQTTGWFSCDLSMPNECDRLRDKILDAYTFIDDLEKELGTYLEKRNGEME